VAEASEEASQEAAAPSAPTAALPEAVEQAQQRVDAALAGTGEEYPASGQQRVAAKRALEHVEELAERAVEAECAKAESAVERVSEDAKAALRIERQAVDEATGRERAERKRAFLEVLAEERRETDSALHVERQASDFLLQSRDEVLAMISHDLRNLIQAMELKMTMLSDALPDMDSTPKKLAQEVFKSCGIMARWATDLVDLSSLDAGALSLQHRPHDPADIVDESSRVFLSLATQKGIRVEVDVDPHRPLVLCDRDRIVQVLANLLSNATKFTPPGGTIALQCKAIDHQVQFSVSDSGPGISDADRANIFERRWHTNERHGGGVGLGLYISKKIIETHGGRIWVESKLKQGRTFCFTLPIATSLFETRLSRI
jgi:signal transduction histidine kinase